MLDLIRRIHEVPVIQFRNIGQNRKYEFADKVNKKWGIKELDFSPIATDLLAKNNRIDFMRVIPIGDILIFLAAELHDPVDVFQCSLMMSNNYPCSSSKVGADYNLVFHGHRGNDVDAMWGSVNLLKDRFIYKDTTMFYPLMDWTEQDIWEYTEKHNLPYNDRRYDKKNGHKEFADKTYNENYHYACTECIDPNKPKEVYCKIVQKEIPNISENMRYEEKGKICKQFVKNIDWEASHG